MNPYNASMITYPTGHKCAICRAVAIGTVDNVQLCIRHYREAVDRHEQYVRMCHELGARK
jgi:hypothetical protein